MTIYARSFALSATFSAALMLFSSVTFARGDSSQSFKRESASVDRDKLIGRNFKASLEGYHFRRMMVDDDVSAKAFDEYLKRIDYGKQFLLKSDVDKLGSYKKKIDDELEQGDFKLLYEVEDLMKKRISEVDKLREEIFKKPFDFNIKETLEVDSKKRSFPKNEKERAELWRKIFKQQVLDRYISYLDGDTDADIDKADSGDEEKSEKKDKKAKSTPKMTDKEMRQKAHDKINEKYTKYFARMSKEDHDDYLERFLNSIAAVYDPHTNYFPPKKKEDFDIDISGQLEGIGAVLQEDGQFIKVVKIVPGGAAWRQKELEVDDVILYVAQGDGEPVDLVDMRVDDAVRYIRGKKGTEVRLTVKKSDGTRKVIPIVRDVVQIDASYAKSSVLELKGLKNFKVGYIHLPKFYRDFDGESNRNCTDDIRMELERLKKSKVDAIVLDLRNNGGGALEDARQMTGLFVKDGPVVKIKDFSGKSAVLKDEDTSITYGGPLIVMTNRFSASASEILAGALQDYGRALIVGGEYSHGKGTVQTVTSLMGANKFLAALGPDLGALKITIQKFYRITGVSTQFKGITPDIVLPDLYGYTESREQDLDYALPFDTVEAEKYEPWKTFHYDIKSLKKQSEARVKKDPRFAKIIESVDYLTKRRKDTLVSLNIDEVRKQDKANKETSERLKITKKSEDLVVTNYEASLRAHENITKGDEKQWKEDFKQRKDDWIKGLQLDPSIEEAMYIAHDIVGSLKGQKLGMAGN